MIKRLTKFFSNFGTSNTKVNQYMFLGFIVLAVYALGVGWSSFISDKKTKARKDENQITEKIKIASDLFDGQKLLEKHYDKRLAEEQKARQEMQTKLLEEIKKLKTDLAQEYRQELSDIERRRIASEDELKKALISMQNKPSNSEPVQEIDNYALKPTPLLSDDARLAGGFMPGFSHSSKGSTIVSNEPKDIGRYIPASTYIKGRLLSGISVSTGVSAQADPIPLLIRLTEDANLPQGFGSKLKDCRIIASCFGDISSERAKIRLESMTCIDADTETAIETKIAGFVVGMDGKNGIRGKVISVDKKYINNAIFGGVASGLSKLSKTESPFAYNPSVGIVQGKEKSLDKFKEGALDGVGSAADRIANYYIKKAESISPVVEVPAGSLVDIVFTQGVYFGGQNVKQKIEEERK